MPPTGVHFNGGVNMPDAETVFRELAQRVGDLAHAYPDGETGALSGWATFPGPALRASEGIVEGEPRSFMRTNDEWPQLTVADGADEVRVGDLGYTEEYLASYEVFCRLRDEGVIPAGVRFQVQLPTPTAPLVLLVRPEDHATLYGPLESAIFADLKRFLAAVPHDDVEVQWDVAAEFGFLEDVDWYKFGEFRDPGSVVPKLVRCIDEVPQDVRVGLHLCYGDYKHGHESEPESLGTQVKLVNDAAAAAHRRIDFVGFTVPQNRDDAGFFEPLQELRTEGVGRLYFGIVPYYPSKQPQGTIARQAAHIDRYVADWGVCTECGMARHEADTVPSLLDLHRSIVEAVSV
jgi:hypothetical protein